MTGISYAAVEGDPRMPDNEWTTVCSVTTNTSPDSCVKVPINTTPICPNMTNAEFRQLIMKLRDLALRLIADRIVALSTMWAREQARVQTWFGRSDDETKQALQQGLARLHTVMKELKPENMLRNDDPLGRTLTCSPVPDSGLNDASICKPDSARRIITFYSHFCTLPHAELRKDCKLKVLIHECSHYVDAFNSLDNMYGTGWGLEIATKNNPDKAHNNADNITCYIAHFEGVNLSGELTK